MSPDVWHITPWEIVLRMIIATGLGGLVGMEREWSNHAAGFRTHILVCLGSATIMLLSIYGFGQFASEPNVRLDPSRLSAQVVSGIGFLGAGAILRNGNVIKGLTTAASVWVVAGIGLCVGAGFLTGAFVCAFLVFNSLFLLNKWEKYLLRNRRYHEVDIKIYDQPGALGRIASTFGEFGIQIVNLKMNADTNDPSESTQMPTMHLCFNLKNQNQDMLLEALGQIAKLDVVISMETHKFQVQKQGMLERANSI
ncbi:MgtC/SapB family protein [Paenibacillus cremeus]|uniref:MgtC/SapB family protein n=1 Tax=Paenibacillus cremeus TaxID=2163881 RepID=A0A559JRB1_9BACL|nr:MgtC/SapB family protein [Paenibacillus cremeus]TVY02421.1 MgtC/SapB family protein [Paenibacillus cremeus]